MNHRRNIYRRRRQLESVRGIRMADCRTSSWLYKAGTKMWVIPRYLFTRSPPNRMWDTRVQVSGGGTAIPLRSDPATIKTRLACVAFFTAFVTVVVPTYFLLYTNIIRFIRSGQGYTVSSYSYSVNVRSEITNRYITVILLYDTHNIIIYTSISRGFYF